GGAAAELGEDRFAVVRARGESPEALAQRLLRLLGLTEDAVTPAAQAMSLTGDASPNQVIRAIRYAVDSFITDGLENTLPTSMAQAVTESVRRTAQDVGALGHMLAEKQFRLVFQPVINLKAGNSVHHHEVLVRFGQDESPFPMIRMAEELDLIESLDLAIAEQTIDKLAVHPGLKLAVNMSGRTVQSVRFVEKVALMIAAKPDVRGRLFFELTESAAISDMPTAQTNLQMLREEGCKVCLDDFGAGAASLAYVQQLPLDFVKIDGRYIRELQHGGRETTFIRHLVRMCAELGVGTVAEMVETKAAEQAVRQAGVDLAQGFLYGAPADEPIRMEHKPAGIRPGLKRVAVGAR
ncbi:MAG TPA: EAL domain-containing protein, partial [Phenylobacterium sp.]